jgi:glucose/arabinose dehydrogenase
VDKDGRPRTKQDIPDWSCKVSRLSGPGLAEYQDYVVGLPRAKHDHASNQPAFGPDGALYFAQASNTAMGAPDSAWGFRPERLLTAAVLRLDVKAVASPPLDVKTEDGGAYDPFAAGAPLTIFASGTRNTYDLLFHSNGRLYGTLNGSARGGNAPGTPQGFANGGSSARRIDQDAAGPYTGPAVPEMRTLPTTNDYLLGFEKGRYYGHPNPARSEFVLNGGNPTRGADPCEVPDYPAGTRPDRNWQAPAFDFGKNLAPCGLIEYRGDAFPFLKGKILVARYSGGKDLLALTPSADGTVSEFVYGIDGFTYFHDPVDVAEDPKTGYLYVSELSGRKITLLRPVPGGVSKRVIRQSVTPPGARSAHPVAKGN